MPYYWMQTQHERSGVRASFIAGVCDLGGEILASELKESTI